MERLALMGWVAALGRAFGRLGMKAHVRALRIYFLALRHGLTTGERHAVKVDFNEEAITEWLRVLRLPPFERAYPVRPRGSTCGRCPRGEGHPVETSTLLTFSGGAKMGCRACGEVWLELEEGGVRSGASVEN